MSAGVPLKLDAIHEEIWQSRNRNNKVTIYQKKFAAHLHISVFTMSRKIKELEESGRIKKIGARYRNVGVYIVNDPAEFSGKNNGLTPG